MDFHPETGLLYAVGRRVSDNRAFLLIIDPLTAAATEIGEINDADNQRVPDMSFRYTDHSLFAWDESVDRLARIDISTGVMTRFGENIRCAGHGMAFSPTEVLYLADCLDFLILDQDTGAPTFVGVLAPMPTPEYRGASALEFNPLTGVLYASITSRGPEPIERYLATIDPATAEVTTIGLSVDGLDALAFQVIEEVIEDRRRLGAGLGVIIAGGARTARENREAAAAAAQQQISPPSTGDAGLAAD